MEFKVSFDVDRSILVSLEAWDDLDDIEGLGEPRDWRVERALTCAAI